MTFERTSDDALIRAIVTHPRIFPHVGDDFTPCADAWRPEFAPYLLYVLCRDGDEVLGLWLFVIRGACWETHACMLPGVWGAQATRCAREMFAWLWRSTPCCRLIASVPSYNRPALAFAARIGMTEFAVNPRSYLRAGELHDQILFGLSRPE
jgi:RimJ/RimL family protein N-acetyltransferase